MNPDKLRFLTSLTQQGEPHSELVVRVTMSLLCHSMPTEFVVWIADEWARYEEFWQRSNAETR